MYRIIFTHIKTGLRLTQEGYSLRSKDEVIASLNDKYIQMWYPAHSWTYELQYKYSSKLKRI